MLLGVETKRFADALAGHRLETLQDYVAAVLARALFRGDLAPGERIPVDQIASELNVSHIPIREALSAFEAQGHVKRISHRGFFVMDISVEDLEDIYRWREVLETEGLREGVPLLTDNDIKEMEDAYREMAKAAKEKDLVRFSEANATFHFVPVLKCNSRRLGRLLSQLWDASARYQSWLLRGDNKFRLIQNQHKDFLEACRARDAEKAIDVTTAHREVTLKKTREALTKSQSLGA